MTEPEATDFTDQEETTEVDRTLSPEELEQIAGGILIGLMPAPPNVTSSNVVQDANAARPRIAPLPTNPLLPSKGNVL